MKSRWIFLAVAAAACLITCLVLLQKADSTPQPGVRKIPALPRIQTPLRQRSSTPPPSHESKAQVEPEEPAVILDFEKHPLPEVINALVRQSGMRVIADFAPVQDSTLVTVQMNAPPLVALQTIADVYQMELLETDAGWWLRPLDAVQRICYRVHDPGGDAESPQIERLVENLRKLAGETEATAESGELAVRVTADAEGIHVSAPREAQVLAAAFLESMFHRTIKAERKDLPASP